MAEIVVKKSNELIDPQAQLLVEFLRDMGLPSENIIADASQRKIIGDNLHSLIHDLPHSVKKDARYLSKFVIGAGFGLFDYSLNAVWNEVVINLRKKAVVYGLDIFFDAAVGGSKAREYYSSEEDLSSLKDSVLLDTCRKLELISDTTYKKLKHILDMRNGDKFASHAMASLSHFEVKNKLHNSLCRKHAKSALELVKKNVINARLIECLDYLITNIESGMGYVDNAEFRKLSAGYINW